MISIEINNTKKFMSALLGGDAFDSFLIEEAVIKTFNTFTIDGKIIPEYYDDYEFGYEFSSWKNIKSVCFELIKGKQLPVSFRFSFLATPKLKSELLKEAGKSELDSLIRNMTFNIIYNSGKVSIVTSVTPSTFIMDKSADEVWDRYIRQYVNRLFD